MKYPGKIGRLIFLSSLAAVAAMPVAATERPVTVVELFTSQGCSSCPPANANLIKISNRKNVLALSFSVTYWDYLGWKDTYGKPEFTERQVAYEPALRQLGPYTPQMVINGTATTVGNSLPEVESLVNETPSLNGPALAFNNDRIEIGTGSADRNGDVWLVNYDPRIEEVPVARGENSGATLQHIHVVRRLARLGTWDGSKTSFSLPKVDKDLKTAVLVQQPNGGPILSAITD